MLHSCNFIITDNITLLIVQKRMVWLSGLKSIISRGWRWANMPVAPTTILFSYCHLRPWDCLHSIHWGWNSRLFITTKSATQKLHIIVVDMGAVGWTQECVVTTASLVRLISQNYKAISNLLHQFILMSINTSERGMWPQSFLPKSRTDVTVMHLV